MKMTETSSSDEIVLNLRKELEKERQLKKSVSKLFIRDYSFENRLLLGYRQADPSHASKRRQEIIRKDIGYPPTE